MSRRFCETWEFDLSIKQACPGSPILSPRFLTPTFPPAKLLVCHTNQPAYRSNREGKSVRAETRHQLKQDAFSRVTIDAAERTAHWSVEHRQTLIISVVAVAVVLAAVIGGWYYLS